MDRTDSNHDERQRPRFSPLPSKADTRSGGNRVPCETCSTAIRGLADELEIALQHINHVSARLRTFESSKSLPEAPSYYFEEYISISELSFRIPYEEQSIRNFI